MPFDKLDEACYYYDVVCICGQQILKERWVGDVKTYRPGQKAVHSGQYEIIELSGRRTGIERTVVKGEPLPPTLKSGQKFILVDPSKNDAGR